MKSLTLGLYILLAGRKIKVSCIMPTFAGRETFARNAITFFRLQDYLQKELLVVTPNPGHFADLEDDNIKVIKATAHDEETKITHALNLMSGQVAMRWDDDDISFGHRIGCSVQEFLHNSAKVMGLKHGFIIRYSSKRLFYCPPLSSDWLHPSGIFWPDHWKGNNDFRGVPFAPLENITIMAFGAHSNNTMRKDGWMKYPLPLEVPKSWL